MALGSAVNLSFSPLFFIAVNGHFSELLLEVIETLMHKK